MATSNRIQKPAAMRSAGARLGHILTAARLGHYEWSSEDQQITRCEVAQEIFGLPAGEAEVRGDVVFQQIHPMDRPAYEALFLQAAQSGEEFHTEYRIIRPRDGKLAWIDERGRVSRDAETGVARISGVVLDITARKQAEEALRYSEQKYRMLFDSIDEGFCIVEVLFDEADRAVDYRFLEANAQFERQSGLKDAIGKRRRELVPEHEAPWFEQYGRIARSGVPERFEQRVDATGQWYDIYAFPVGNPAENRIAILFNDITGRKLTEAALLESENRFRSISHELRTPLASILSWARLLQARLGVEDEVVEQGLQVIVNNTLAQSRLIADLLDAGASAPTALQLVPEDVKLDDLLASACESQQLAAEQKGVTLTCNLREPLGSGVVDGVRLRQVIQSLLSNAIKFTPAGGQVTVATHRHGFHRVIEVRDTGAGIVPGLLPSLFQVGLGLSTAKQIIEMHGGSIEAHSAGPGTGATFTVMLPDFPAHAAEAAPEALQGLRILAVDDQADMRDFLQRALADHKAQVTVVDSADRAMQVLLAARDDSPFDVLISDIGMPGMNGYEFMYNVRHELHLGAGELPAVAVTAFAREDDRRRALDAGFQAHLTKPYNMETLVAVLRQLK
jgi:PAS domain S-box-containing protein